MQIINFIGLDCYSASLVTLAKHMGVDYRSLFLGLWAETDFSYNKHWEVYVSQQLFSNLADGGLLFEALDVLDKANLEDTLLGMKNESYAVVGMDSFEIPWSPVFKIMKNPHYFIAQKDGPKNFTCYDPTYGTQGMNLDCTTAAGHSFNILILQAGQAKPMRKSLLADSVNINSSIKTLTKSFLYALEDNTDLSKANLLKMAKYTHALINNRRLYKQFLQFNFPQLQTASNIFDKEYFKNWESIKNGFYKAALLKDNTPACAELANLVKYALQNEAAQAQQILKLADK